MRLLARIVAALAVVLYAFAPLAGSFSRPAASACSEAMSCCTGETNCGTRAACSGHSLAGADDGGGSCVRAVSCGHGTPTTLPAALDPAVLAVYSVPTRLVDEASALSADPATPASPHTQPPSPPPRA